jgi:hypothetical protein
VKRFLQHEHIELRKSPTEIACCRGIWNPLSTQGIQIRFVIASQFQMLQTLTTSKQIEGDVEHVIGFAVGQMKPQDRAPPIDAVSDIELPDQLLHDSHAPSGNRLRPLGKFILNRPSRQHGRLPIPVNFINTIRRPTLSSFESSSYIIITLHLKTSLRPRCL